MASIFDNLYKSTQSVEDGRVSGRGIGAFLLNPLVDEDKLNQAKQTTINTDTALGLGEDLADLDVAPGASTLEVRGAAIRKGRVRTKENETTAHERSLEPLKAELALTRQQGKDNYNLALAQLSSAERRALEDRIEAREQRALELEYQRMRDRKEDRLYNERMEKLDRKDRILAMQNIAAGLASLGAAFAV